MISGYPPLVIILVSIVSVLNYFSGMKGTSRFFKYIPAVFWIYMIPMLLSTFKVIDGQSGIFKDIVSYMLPASLVLLLVQADIPAIMRLGKPALLMMLAGSIGVMIGAPLSFSVLKGVIGTDMWSGFGALSASWIGGSANMIAVKEAIGTPDGVFMRMVFVDTIVPYLWMGILIFCAGSQARFDKWNQVDEKIITDLRENAVPAVQSKTGARPGAVAIVVFMAAIGAVVSRFVAGFLPVVEGVVTFATWQIIAASGLGIALSFTPVKKIEDHGASKVGYYFLYLVLAAIGARSYIDRTGTVLVLVAGGCMIVAVHAFVLYIAARLLKAPLFLVAAASQANIGGVASAPVVAAVYQPGLASVGLLLAVSGNIMGTYLGVITSHLCRAIAG